MFWRSAELQGLALVTSHLGRLSNLPFVIFYALRDFSFNFQSWWWSELFFSSLFLSVGSVFYSMICAGIIFKGSKWQKLVSPTDLMQSFPFSVFAVSVYSGFLLTQAVGVSLWNSSLIPVLGLCPAWRVPARHVGTDVGNGLVDHKSVGWCSRTSVWVDTAKPFAIFSFVYVALGSASIGARAGAEALISGNQALMFWIGESLSVLLCLFWSICYLKPKRDNRRCDFCSLWCLVFKSFHLFQVITIFSF